MASTLRLLAPLTLTLLALGACGEPADPSGLWGEKSDRTPYLELKDDGRVFGFDSCNRVLADWEADGGDVTFSQVSTTKMACPELDTWLSGMASAEIDGDTMVVKDADGTEIGQLAR